MLEVVRISRQGYPTRYVLDAFTERFGFLLPTAAQTSYGRGPLHRSSPPLVSDLSCTALDLSTALNLSTGL